MLFAIVSGCRFSTEPTPTQRTVKEIQGSRQDRIYAFSRIMSANAREHLINTVTDVSLIEEKFGDGNFGPSDYRHMGRIKVLPPDVARWSTPPSRLTGDLPVWSGAPLPVSWWITEQAFARLKFYEARPIFGQDGWIGASPEGVLYFTIATR